jgi:hypothetical protein
MRIFVVGGAPWGEAVKRNRLDPIRWIRAASAAKKILTVVREGGYNLFPLPRKRLLNLLLTPRRGEEHSDLFGVVSLPAPVVPSPSAPLQLALSGSI